MSGGSACDGWRPIPLKPSSAVYLVSTDRPAGVAIASHNAFGARKCHWTTGGAF